jgi:hypothetical protein
MSRFNYQRNAERDLARQPAVRAALGAIAGSVGAEAVRIAQPISSRFADGIDTTTGIDADGPYGRVNANWWGSLFVELGTATQRPRAILRQALDARTSR